MEINVARTASNIKTDCTKNEFKKTKEDIELLIEEVSKPQNQTGQINQ